MKTLYITSLQTRGKTTMCIGLGLTLKHQGKRVGYFKPVCLTESVGADEQDILFARNALEISEPLERLSISTLSRTEVQAALTSPTRKLATGIKESLNQMSSNYDVILVEGAGSLESDAFAAELCRQITDGGDGRVIVVIGYSEPLPSAETTSLCLSFGSRLLGIIVNCVPAGRLPRSEKLRAAFQSEGILLLGVLPEDRRLIGISVEQIATTLNGSLPGAPEAGAVIAESFMIGAISLDPTATYFRRMSNKCVIVGSARPDIQIAALETNTVCLVLTGDTPTIDAVSRLAERKGIPLIRTSVTTQDAISRLESEFKRASFNTRGKLTRLNEILDHYIDLPELQRQMSLAG